MAARLWVLVGVLSLCVSACAQERKPAPPAWELYGGYSELSNSLNGVPGHRQPLNGWETALGFPGWHGLRFKVDLSSYRGTNLGAKQDVYFITGGGEYDWLLGRETVFTQALFGDGGASRYWGANGLPGMTASFTTVTGGGLDTRLTRRFSWRVQDDFQWINFALVESLTNPTPYDIPGLPNYFNHFSTGMVWRF